MKQVFVYPILNDFKILLMRPQADLMMVLADCIKTLCRFN
jgi:hypothetical protein